MATKSFKERNPLHLGLIGTAVIAVLMVAVFNYQAIPFLTGARTVTGEFADASGLAAGDHVQIGGVEIGEVESITLRPNHVDIELRIDPHGRTLGARTHAAIKVETALGRRYVELTPDGDGELGDTIPADRTTSGFDITDSLSRVTETLEGTDKSTASQALTSISELMNALPDNLKQSSDGIARIADTVASRDTQIRQLLDLSTSVSGVLSERNNNLTALITDGETLFAALNDRAATIRSLLVQVRAVSEQIRGVVADNRDSTAPMLAELDTVLTTLNQNYTNIDNAITGLRPFVTQLGEVVGSGPFFSVLLQNIAPANLRGQMPGSPGGVN
ncbi:MCE family protein [Rhodococcus opacus]|uniref:MCE family protein n=1 Tax=Rhodococcus opacus TaxID=37919 RepID=UPI001C9DF770|nr:MCE family protein [Rhodococcus opacus]QZS56821.1 MCE family protein [Rhodococcus opacus]